MYDGSNQAVSCSITEQNQGKICTVSWHILSYVLKFIGLSNEVKCLNDQAVLYFLLQNALIFLRILVSWFFSVTRLSFNLLKM